MINTKRRLFEKYQIPAPRTLKQEEWAGVDRFPVIVKPLDGMGSSNVFRAENTEELAFFTRYVENPIVQSCAMGTEYTIDVLCDEQGTPVYIVPRIRLEVRSGEVVKSRTVQQREIGRTDQTAFRGFESGGKDFGSHDDSMLFVRGESGFLY